MRDILCLWLWMRITIAVECQKQGENVSLVVIISRTYLLVRSLGVYLSNFTQQQKLQSQRDKM